MNLLEVCVLFDPVQNRANEKAREDVSVLDIAELVAMAEDLI